MKHLSVKGCQIVSNEGPGSLPMGDNNWGENENRECGCFKKI